MTSILIAGFGGQGVLFTGKVLAYIGMLAGQNVTWLPSYGPEMRGGTANCGVCISDTPIGSPLVTAPDILMVMNTPSYVRFIGVVQPSGSVFADASLVAMQDIRQDVSLHAIDASRLAEAEGLRGFSNIVLLGKMLAATGLSTHEAARDALAHCVPARKADMMEPNVRALLLGATAPPADLRKKE